VKIQVKKLLNSGKIHADFLTNRLAMAL